MEYVLRSKCKRQIKISKTSIKKTSIERIPPLDVGCWTNPTQILDDFYEENECLFLDSIHKLMEQNLKNNIKVKVQGK